MATVPDADGRLVAGPDGDSYGPVRANETLWGISERLSADSSVSLNADDGCALPRQPGGVCRQHQPAEAWRHPAGARAGELTALSAGEATSEVRRQNEAWRAGADSSPGAARLQLVPPAEKPAAHRSVSRLTASRAEMPDGKALEQELAESSRLLSLKDSQLKALQDRLELGAARRVDEPPVETPVEAPVERLPIEDSAAC